MRATVSGGGGGPRGARGRGPGGPVRGGAGVLLQGDPEGRSHLRLQQRRGGRRDSRRPARWAGRSRGRASGPNGETVVGDSERALQLFYFKHGISEAVPEPIAAAPAHRVARRQDADHDRLRLPRDLESRPGAIHARIPGRHLADSARHRRRRAIRKGSFRIRRAKFKLEGWFWIPPEVAPAPPAVTHMPKLSYELQLNWAAVGATSARSRPTSAPSSRTPTSRGIRRGWASSASSSDSSRCRSAGRR